MLAAILKSPQATQTWSLSTSFPHFDSAQRPERGKEKVKEVLNQKIIDKNNLENRIVKFHKVDFSTLD